MTKHDRSSGARRGRSIILFALLAGSTPGIATAQDAIGAAAAGVGSPFELAFWQSVAASNDVAQLDAYLQRYPNGTFAGLARAKIAALSPQQAAPAAPVTAPMQAAPMQAPPVRPAPEAVTAPAAAAATPPVPDDTPTPIAAPATAAVAAPPISEPPMSPTGVQPYSTPAAVRAALPLQPTLAAVPAVTLPARFCSAAERDDFYTRTIRPASEIAAGNNRKANAYLDAVQVQHDAYSKNNDMTGINITAQEAIGYGKVAADAFKASSDFTALYQALMALPIEACR